MKKQIVLAGMILLTTVACNGRLPSQTSTDSKFLAQASGTTATATSTATTSNSSAAPGTNMNVEKQLKQTENIEKKMDESIKDLGATPGAGKEGSSSDTVRPYLGKDSDIKLQKEFENTQKIDAKLTAEQQALQDASKTETTDNKDVVRPFVGKDENVRLEQELKNNQTIEEKSQEKVESLSK